jgi:hypothetical protein
MCDAWRLRCAFVGFAGYCACHIAAAAEWSMQPTVEWYLDHDSNRLLQPVREISDEEARLTVDALLKRATETGEVDVHPEVQILRFFGDSALDSNNGSLQMSGKHTGEVFTYSAGADYADRSTFISELENTGIIDATARQEAANANAAVVDKFTERQRVGVQAAYTNVRYPGGQPVGLVGYRGPSISTTYTYGLSPQTSLSASAFDSRITAPDVGFSSRNDGGRFAWAYILSPTTNLSAAAGVSRAHIGSQDVTGSLWALQGTHNAELTQWTFSFTRDVVPSGFGLLIRRDELDLSVIHKIAERFDTTLSLLAARNNDLTAAFVAGNRRYFTGAVGLDWHATPQWLLSLKLRASEANVPSDVEELRVAKGWQSVLTLLWTPLPRSRSR